MAWCGKGDATTQSSFREQLICFYLKKQFPDTISRYKEIGGELDIFVPSLRVAIEYDGCYWHRDSQNRDKEKDLLCQQAGITLIRIRENGLSELPDSICYVLADNGDTCFVQTLQTIFAERFSYSPTIDLSKDGFEVVKEYKVQASSPWYRAYEEAKSFYEENGHLRVPKDYITDSGIRLGAWIMLQRQCHKGNKKPFSENQVSLLDAINMIWNPHELQWEEAFSYAKMYFEEYGNLLISQNTSYKGFRLGKWIQGQRLQKKIAKNYSQSRIERLESIGMIWVVRTSNKR